MMEGTEDKDKQGLFCLVLFSRYLGEKDSDWHRFGCDVWVVWKPGPTAVFCVGRKQYFKSKPV